MEESETAYGLFESNYDSLTGQLPGIFPDLLHFAKAYIIQNIS
jgi:hypothetical protein